MAMVGARRFGGNIFGRFGVRFAAGAFFGLGAGSAFAQEAAAEAERVAPSLLAILPFAAMLLSIALLPLIPRTHHWWEKNLNRLIVSLALASVTILYYWLRGRGLVSHGHESAPGLGAVAAALQHAMIDDYFPFIVLLFSLFAISGGILIGGDIPAKPGTNALILLIGAAIASFVGTTGASMLLIRPLLQTNSERKHVVHTVIFFIFLVSNCGGLLLPVGDPPLFLGYLRGVPFFWTMGLFAEWAMCVSLLLAVYFVVDSIFYRRETEFHKLLDRLQRLPIRVRGGFNFALLLGVVLAVAFLVPGKPLVGTSWVIPHGWFLREWVQLALALASLWMTPKEIHKANAFEFYAIKEVAALFVGIFITMQPAIEILGIRGRELGLDDPMHFFWATGLLSSVLDNAPTYVVFFTTALEVETPGMARLALETATGEHDIGVAILRAISCGSVFLGAVTYIGNGPNFMVKSIAERYGIKMPSFFGYMLWSGVFLMPVFILVSWVFFRT
jgi:Na+/H+ antiporter NhaD/arsenite permease-like protein